MRDVTGHACGCVQECSILKSLNYDKNIVQFFGAVLRPGVEPMLVLEFMEVRTGISLLDNEELLRVATSANVSWPARMSRPLPPQLLQVATAQPV